MKYTIGCHVLGKDGHVADGVYVFGEYGLPYITNEIPTNGKNSIYVIDGEKDTQAYIQYLSRLYRTEFRKRAKNTNAPVKEFRFYPIKMTDNRVKNLVLEKDSHYKPRKRDDGLQFLGNTYNVGVYYVKA